VVHPLSFAGRLLTIGVIILQRFAKRLTPLFISFEQFLAHQGDSHSAGTSQLHQKQKQW
jgi:hypothetical protein